MKEVELVVTDRGTEMKVAVYVGGKEVGCLSKLADELTQDDIVVEMQKCKIVAGTKDGRESREFEVVKNAHICDLTTIEKKSEIDGLISFLDGLTNYIKGLEGLRKSKEEVKLYKFPLQKKEKEISILRTPPGVL